MLHELDIFIEDLKKKYNGTDRSKKKRNPRYYRLSSQIDTLSRQIHSSRFTPVQKTRLEAARKILLKQRKRTISLHTETSRIRLEYARYADDWLLGV